MFFSGDRLPGFSDTIVHPDGLVLVDTGMIDTTPAIEEDGDPGSMGRRASASEPDARARGRGPALASATLLASRRQRSTARAWLSLDRQWAGQALHDCRSGPATPGGGVQSLCARVRPYTPRRGDA